ncbi:MAG: DUF6514 family protein [Clostridia bacterium]
MKHTLDYLTKKVGEKYLKYFLFETLETEKRDYSILIEAFYDNTEEFEYVTDFAESKSEAEFLFEKLYFQTVTPDSLLYVIEDYITEKSFL